MAYKDKDKQREAQRDWVRQKRAEQKGSTSIMDANGNEHPIDFDGRRRDCALLNSWAKGEGTAWQMLLGLLSRHYTRIKGIDTGHYLGTV